MSANFQSAPGRFGTIAARTPFVLAGMRIGLLGGSFNPAHAAHTMISDVAYRRLRLDAVWWIVTPGNPLKSHDDLPSQAERIADARALAQRPWLKITAFEANLGTAYTAQTLAFLTRRHSGARFVWLMGADNLASFHKWQDWRGIAATVAIAVVDRPGYRLAASASPAALALAQYYVPERAAASLTNRPTPAWTFLSNQLSDLSSSAIRAGQRQKTDI